MFKDMFKNKGEIALWLLAGVLIAAVIGFCTPKITHKNDGPVEQATEMFIKDKTGLDVDFSPDDKDANVSTK